MAEGYPALDKKPFERKHLDTAQDIVNIRLNAQEREELNLLKSILHAESNGTVIKWCVNFLLNVIQSKSNEQFYRWLSDERRVRPWGLKK